MQKLAIFVIIILLCFACTENSDKTVTNSSNNTEAVPANLFTKEKPADAISVAQARELPAGSEVKVFGEVIGSKNPFVAERASFIIGDPAKLTVCTDVCEAPWDSCCDDKKIIAASTLSVQVLNEKGQVIKANLKGHNGLQELSKVVVQGKVDASSTTDFMIINVDKIYVE